MPLFDAKSLRITIGKIRKFIEKESFTVPENNWIDEYFQMVDELSNHATVYQTTSFGFVCIDDIYRVIEPPINTFESALLKKLKEMVLQKIEININSKFDLKSRINDAIQDVFEMLDIPEELGVKFSYYILRDFLGYGKIDVIMNDKMVEDISCPAPELPVYVYHQRFGSLKTNVVFEKYELDAFVSVLAHKCGKHITIAEPILDATLPDGSRVNLTYGREVTRRGSTFTIRKFKEKIITPLDLIANGSISAEMLAYLWVLVERKASILVAGEVATGKTTLLNAFSLFIPKNLKI